MEVISTPVATTPPTPTVLVVPTPPPSNPFIDGYIASSQYKPSDGGSTGGSSFVQSSTMKYDAARGQVLLVTGNGGFNITDAPDSVLVQILQASGKTAGAYTVSVNGGDPVAWPNPDADNSFTVKGPAFSLAFTQAPDSNLNVNLNS